MQLDDFKAKHAGERSIVFGCGPSASQIATSHPFFSVGVNDVGGRVDIDYLVVQDHCFQMPLHRWKSILNNRSKFVFSPFPLDEVSERENFVRLPLAKCAGVAELFSGRLNYSSTSVYLATCLSAFMGARRIGILGLDLIPFRDALGAPVDHSLSKHRGRIDFEFGRLASALTEVDVQICNLSSISALTSLPKMSTHDFLSGDL